MGGALSMVDRYTTDAMLNGSKKRLKLNCLFKQIEKTEIIVKKLRIRTLCQASQNLQIQRTNHINF